VPYWRQNARQGSIQFVRDENRGSIFSPLSPLEQHPDDERSSHGGAFLHGLFGHHHWDHHFWYIHHKASISQSRASQHIKGASINIQTLNTGLHF
jgi:hypothetical protein